MRTVAQKFKDFVFFPLRAITLHYDDKWSLTSLASERFDYVAREVTGYCLDVGCGRYNRFIVEYCGGRGKGIDVYPYEGLSDENIVLDISRFPFENDSFNSITFIANLAHVPRSLRDIELKEAFRCLRPGGNIIVTMGNPLAEILVHKVVRWHDKLFGTNYDIDTERGMGAEEEYYLLDSEVVKRLSLAGFRNITKKYFLTQWCLNHLFVAWKPK
ncbi:MAG: class I SAM-dependent methyltransferase [Patescibacteria group bacterium]